MVVLDHGANRHLWRATWSPDGRRLASATGRAGNVCVWDVATARIAHTLDAHTDVVQWVAWCPNGRRLASFGRDGMVVVWDASVRNGLQEVLRLVTNRVYRGGLDWSPDGNLVCYAGTQAR